MNTQNSIKRWVKDHKKELALVGGGIAIGIGVAIGGNKVFKILRESALKGHQVSITAYPLIGSNPVGIILFDKVAKRPMGGIVLSKEEALEFGNYVVTLANGG